MSNITTDSTPSEVIHSAATAVLFAQRQAVVSVLIGQVKAVVPSKVHLSSDSVVATVERFLDFANDAGTPTWLHEVGTSAAKVGVGIRDLFAIKAGVEAHLRRQLLAAIGDPHRFDLLWGGVSALIDSALVALCQGVQDAQTRQPARLHDDDSSIWHHFEESPATKPDQAAATRSAKSTVIARAKDHPASDGLRTALIRSDETDLSDIDLFNPTAAPRFSDSTTPAVRGWMVPAPPKRR